MASNTITAHNNYSIVSDGINQGRVDFIAGNKITLGDGFSVKDGGYFHGYIDPAVKPMTCTSTGGNCNSSLKEIPWDTTGMAGYDTLLIQSSDPIAEIGLNEDIFGSETENSKANQLSVIPNPSKGVFTLICEKELQYFEIRDVLGNLILTSKVNNVGINIDIDLSSYPTGIYFLKAQGENEIYTEKVIIQQ